MMTNFINRVYDSLCGSSSLEATTHRRLQALSSKVDYTMFKHLCEDIAVPVLTKPHRLFSLGGSYPKALLVGLGMNEWVSLKTLVNDISEGSIHIYDEYGYLYPLAKTFFYLNETELLMAVQGNKISDILYLKMNNTLVNLHDSTPRSTYVTSGDNISTFLPSLLPVTLATTLKRGILGSGDIVYKTQPMLDGDSSQVVVPTPSTGKIGIVLTNNDSETNYANLKIAGSTGLAYLERHGGAIPQITSVDMGGTLLSKNISIKFLSKVVRVTVRREGSFVFIYFDNELIRVFNYDLSSNLYLGIYIEKLGQDSTVKVESKYQNYTTNSNYILSPMLLSQEKLLEKTTMIMDRVLRDVAATPNTLLHYEASTNTAIESVSTLKVLELTQFTSNISPKENRYILPLEGIDSEIISRQYLDIYVTYGDGVNMMGLYYGIYKPSSLRMLTSRHITVSVDQYVSIANKLLLELASAGQGSHLTINDLNFVVKIRKPSRRGYINHSRDLTNVLLAFPEIETEDILAGNHGINIWDTKKLEQSSFAQMVNACDHSSFPLSKMIKTLGYDGLLLAGDSVPFSNSLPEPTYVIPSVFNGQENVTVYEHGLQGQLLNHTTLDPKTTFNRTPVTKSIETIHGTPSDSMVLIPFDLSTSVPTEEECVFIASFDGVYKNVLQDDVAEIVNGKIEWIATPRPIFMMDMKTHYLASYDFPATANTSNNLSIRLKNADNSDIEYPRRTLTVFANNEMLVNGIDYSYKAGIISINKVDVYSGGSNLVVKVRMVGLAETEQVVANDYGFITPLGIAKGKGNRVNVKGRYLNANGRLYSGVGESAYDINAQLFAPLTFMPYHVASYDVPLKEAMGESYLVINKEDDTNLKEVEAYLDISRPVTDLGYTPSLDLLHKLYSPFLNKILNVAMTDAAVDSMVNTDDAKQWCEPYEYLLELDPHTYLDDSIIRYVDIAPVKKQGINVPLVKSNFLSLVYTAYLLNVRNGMKLHDLDEYYNEV